MKRWLKRFFFAGLVLGIITGIFFLVCHALVVLGTRDQIKTINGLTAEYQAVIVLGAKVQANGQPSDMLADRLKTAAELYKAKRVKKILVSGDHGQTTYNEVKTMRDYLLSLGVAPKDLFLDHAGFDTYDSLYRAKAIFHIQNAVIVTQAFHLPRALYIADGLGLDTVGVTADKQMYLATNYYRFRETLARIKAIKDLTINAQPKYLGEAIPITGDGQVTWDDK